MTVAEMRQRLDPREIGCVTAFLQPYEGLLCYVVKYGALSGFIRTVHIFI